jgi:hypothetical protein
MRHEYALGDDADADRMDGDVADQDLDKSGQGMAVKVSPDPARRTTSQKPVGCPPLARAGAMSSNFDGPTTEPFSAIS